MGRRRLEAEISRYFDASLDLLANVDLRGRFTRVNPAWERTLGHSAQAMRGRRLIEFVHPDDREATRAEIAAIADGSRDGAEFYSRFRAADGKYRWLEWNVSASPSKRAIDAAARDITVQRRAQQQLANSAKWLETKVAERTYELDDARAEMLQLLAVVVEYRDDETFQHTERVGVSAAEIAARLGLRTQQIGRLREAAPLHDIGKIAIPDSILLKPGNLSAQEQKVMESHAALGARLLSRSSSPVLQMAAVIAATHHEWWNGSGYPGGLAGERIPTGRPSGRRRRRLRRARPRATLQVRVARQPGHRQDPARVGSQFDPRVVAAFVATQGEDLAGAEAGSGSSIAELTVRGVRSSPRVRRRSRDLPVGPVQSRRRG